MAKNYTGYELSRAWFDFAFENPEKITPNHTALFFFAIEHCNRLGWKEKFGFPMEMAKNAIGIKNYRTYSNAFNDLVDWGFFVMHQKSLNQWSANIIALAKNTQANAEANTTAPTKALDKAMQRHLQSHSQKQRIGSVGIDKQIHNNTVTINTVRSEQFERFWKYYKKGSKKASREKFLKLTDAECEVIKIHLPAYFKANPDKKFRKDAERYLSNRLWENDDIEQLSQKATLPKDWWNAELTEEQLELLSDKDRNAKKNHDLRKQFGV